MPGSDCWLETKRLRVRRFRADDADALWRVLSDPQVMQYIEPPYTREQTGAFLNSAGLGEPPLVYAAVWKADASVIGQVIYHPYDKHSYEIGWILHREYWRRGIAAELTQALIQHAKQHSIETLVMECDPAQTATIRIAEKFGFQKISGDELLVFQKCLAAV